MPTPDTHPKPPITCHVLDTTTGKPAPSLPVTLTLHPSPPAASLSTATTSSPAATATVAATIAAAAAATPAAPLRFSATTNSDGRVVAWTPVAGSGTGTGTTTNTTTNTTAATAAAITAATGPTTSTPLAPLSSVFRTPGDQHYSLTFDTEAYFHARGIDTLFPQIDVRFVVRQRQKDQGEHFHVPLLLSGFGYSTYRGS